MSRTVPSSYSQPPCAQNADHLAQNTPNSPIFTKVVCVLGDSLPSAGRLEGSEGAGRTGGPGCGARGRQGLAGLRDDAPSHTSATRPRRCGGRRKDRRAWLRRPWAVAGPGRASRSTTPSRRLACGDLAGGPPPTGAPSSPAPQQDPTAPGTPVGSEATTTLRPRRAARAGTGRGSG